MCRTTLVWIVVSLLLAASGCWGSDEPDGSESENKQESRQQTDVGAEAGEDLGKKRSAFGLPFPPKVSGVLRLEGSVEMTTRMSLPDLAEFYRTRLVDYEVLRPAKNKIRVIGLREFMPAIRGHKFGPKVTLFYFPSREKPEAPDVGTASADAGPTSTVADRQEEEPAEPHQPGTPVRLKTPEGDLLAPGAKWGEPYTPPAGSPLHRPRYKSNFGKPLGEWQLP